MERFAKSHQALTTFACSKKRRVDLETVNAELDRFLARARAMNDSLKAYREAIAKRPDATPSEAQKLLQTVMDQFTAALKESLGLPSE